MLIHEMIKAGNEMSLERFLIDWSTASGGHLINMVNHMVVLMLQPVRGGAGMRVHNTLEYSMSLADRMVAIGRAIFAHQNLKCRMAIAETVNEERRS